MASRRAVTALCVAVSLGVVACSSGGDSSPAGEPNDERSPVTLGQLDDVVVTVSPEDLTGELIVIGDTVPPSESTSPAVTSAIGLEPEPIEPERNVLGGDDPEDRLMPDVVCMDLQAAQDEIQDHGVFLSKSVDASGRGRRQLWDRNWVVVDQTPAAGEPIGENEAVLSVVKDDEDSRC